MNEKKYYKNETEFSVPRHVNHEICHFVHDKLVEEKAEKTSSKLCKIWTLKRYYNRKSFREGFCEYMSLDYLADLYDKQTLKKVWKDMGLNASYRNFSSEFTPYERGYKFFRKVLSVIGKDKVFEVARSPPICELEIRIPALYLLRRYPAQGIRNILKLFSRNIRTNIVKKLYF